MTKAEYAEWCLSLEWYNLNQELIKHHPKCCFKCRAGGIPLQTHHLFYRSHPRLTQPQDIVRLCDECHRLVEKAKKSGLISKSHTAADITAIPYRIVFKATPAAPKKPRKKTLYALSIDRQALMEELNSMPFKCKQAAARCMGVEAKDDMTCYSESPALRRRVIPVRNIIANWKGLPAVKAVKSRKKWFNHTWRTGRT